MKKIVAVITALPMIVILALGSVGGSVDPFAEGIKLFNQGKYNLAVRQLAKAVSNRPNDAARRVTYGVVLANSRRYDDAAAQFRRAAEIAPGDPVPLFLLQGAYLGKGQAVQAEEAGRAAGQRLTQQEAKSVMYKGKDDRQAGLLDRAIAEYPENAIAENLLGDIAQVQQRYDEAVRHYRRAADLAPHWIKPWFNLGMANLVINPAEAARNFRRVISLDPKNLQAQLWLGDAYAEQRDYQNALQAYRQAAGSQSLEPAARSRIGNVYLKQNDLQQAEKEFNKAVKSAPHDPAANAGLGDVYQRQQRLDESARQYKKASELTQAEPSQQAILAPNLANVYIEQGECRKAIDELKRVIALNPSLPEPVRMLADAYERCGLFSEGIKDYEAALAKNPHDISAMRFLVLAYGRSGNAEGRAQVARKLLKAAPRESAEWNRELGAALVSLGDREGAMKAWRTGLEINPSADAAGILPIAESSGMLNDLALWYEKKSAVKKAAAPSLILATIYERRCDFAHAVEVRRKVARTYPQNGLNWLQLGDDLTRSEDKEAARAVYTRVIGMGDAVLRAAAEQRIKQLGREKL